MSPLKKSCLLAVSCIALGYGSAQAKDRMDTVIVTAPGQVRTADELISNVSAMDRDDIVESLSGSLGDTLDRQPGVASTFFGQGASRPVLRGLGSERVQVLTNGIGVIDASAASPDHQVGADGIDADRIEILRGPAALIYGGQAIGGVVNVIDGMIAESIPDKPFSADAYTAWNSVSEGSEVAAKGQATTGHLVFTLNGSMRDLGDYEIPGEAESARQRASEGDAHEEHEEENTGLMENSFLETSTLSGGVSWVGDKGFLGIAVRQQDSKYGLSGHSHAEDEDHDEDHADDDDHDHEHEEEQPFIDLSQTRVDLRGEYRFDHDIVKRFSGAVAIADYEHTEFEAPGEPGTRYENNGWEGRAVIDHELAGLNGVVGIHYLDKELGAFGDEAFIRPTTTKSLSAFVYESHDWENDAGIEGGLRLENTELDNTENGSVDFDLISASLGLHKHWDNGWFLGAQLSHTERAPNESELFADGPHLATLQYEIGDKDLNKESGLNLEGTVRWQSDTVQVGLNVFSTTFSDFIYLTPGTTLVDGSVVSDVDGVAVYKFAQQDAGFIGGEAYITYTPQARIMQADWTFSASVDQVSAELDDGSDVPYLPPLTLNAGAEANWSALTLGADITIAADQNDTGEGQFATDGFTSLDLNASYQLAAFSPGLENTKVFITARNVTDEEIRQATSVLKDLVPSPGRNIRFGVKASF